jgi:hypothetical protein
LSSFKPLVKGADLLHCTALPLTEHPNPGSERGREEQEHVRLQAQLVLRVRWPRAPSGQQVCVKYATNI